MAWTSRSVGYWKPNLKADRSPGVHPVRIRIPSRVIISALFLLVAPVLSFWKLVVVGPLMWAMFRSE